jgi:hypothetical protein
MAHSGSVRVPLVAQMNRPHTSIHCYFLCIRGRATRKKGSTAGGTSRHVGFGTVGSWGDSIRRNLDPRYLPSFVDLAKASLDDFDAVIPIRTVDYPPLAQRPELRGHRFFHPSAEVVALCDDKLRLAEFLVAEGFSEFVPCLRSPGPPYPYVWKKRRGHWGKQCHIVHGARDERVFDLSDPDWFAQELVRGSLEFATHILRVDGKIRYVSTFAHEMAGVSLVQGVQQQPLSSRLLSECAHLPLFSQILALLSYEGTACFDYKEVEGRPLLFEINPRYGGTLTADVTAYVDAYLDALT